jgi:UDP-hydrolysing UDP-N-acetyl-D-glucosamine 2-epimerase
MKEIQNDSDLKLQIIATGTHLSHEFGLTYKQIESDGFTIDIKLDMLLSSDTSPAVIKSIGLGIISFADAFEYLKPDLIVLLGDRFEILAAAQASLIAKIPIAHIHGGELTEGAYDESIRHSITKMAYLHFVAAESYRKRVIQLGENPKRVFNFGAPGLDAIQRMNFIKKEDLESEFKVKINSPFILVTYHPVTLESIEPSFLMKQILEALDFFPEATILFTYPNSDTGGRILIDLIESFVRKNPYRSKAFTSLGQKKYLSLLYISDLVLGNSSSGIIEAPALKKATVNLGDRQKGRLKATSIIDSSEDKESIIKAIKMALSNEFRSSLENTISLYGDGDTSRLIKDELKKTEVHIRKPFYDVEFDY